MPAATGPTAMSSASVLSEAGAAVEPGAATRWTRRRALQLGAGALFAAAFWACGGGGANLLVSEQTSSDRRPPGGTLRIARRPNAGAGAPPPDLVYARLMALDPRTGQLHRDLAEHVELTPDLVLTVRITGSARFHPGSDGQMHPVRAIELQHDLERRAAAGEFLAAHVLDVPRIVRLDDRTLRLPLRGPFAALFEYLSHPQWGSVRGAPDQATGIPLGTGAFVPASTEPGAFTLSRHPGFHRPNRPRLTQLVIAVSETAAALPKAVSGQAIDVQEHPLPPDREVLAQAGHAVMRRASRGLAGLGLSMIGQKGGAQVRYVAAFQDERVRRAVSRALDYTALAARIDGVTSGPVSPAFGPDALTEREVREHEIYQRDLDAVHALLSAAGHQELNFRIEVPARSGARELAVLVEQQLREAGINARASLQPEVDFAQSLRIGDFEAALFVIDDLATPDLGLRLHTSGGVDGAFSPWGYSNPVYDAAAREALSAMLPAERAERSRAAQRLLLDGSPAMLPIAAPTEYATAAPRVRGYEFDAYDFNGGWLAAGWNVTT